MRLREVKIEDGGWRIDGETRRRSAIHYPLSSILYLLSSLLLLSQTGCAMVGAVAHKVVGEPPVPAQYMPDKNKPMFVLVENYRNPAAGRMDGQRLMLHLADELRRHRVAPVVDPEEANALRARADYRTMKVEEVGAAAGAKQVLYVHLGAVSIDNTVGGEMIKASAEMRVRVVDVATGRTLWPTDTPEGHLLMAQTSWSRTSTGAPEGIDEPALRDQVARGAANQIVRLFRKWHPDDEEQDLQDNVR